MTNEDDHPITRLVEEKHEIIDLLMQARMLLAGTPAYLEGYARHVGEPYSIDVIQRVEKIRAFLDAGLYGTRKNEEQGK